MTDESTPGRKDMIAAEMSSKHIDTLKSWTNSAEYNRIQMRDHVAINPHGCYRVRMKGESKWFDCDSPPSAGAAEWIFVNRRAVPLFYWNSEKKSVVLI